MYKDLRDKAFEHKHALIFVGGIAAASELEESIQDIKDNAEDIHTDAKAAKKEAVCVDVTAEDE